ncbi:hypothetical protein BCR42DRAFT_443013 [Absidia repens]|uniref:Uncharacterized protein n=1 Tax=Absidia repens TaxID=90262 RepID=A0A1X2I0Y9_9FUNG|nr:hypothetical protein BCR42DRAFT_443013 [Absidia repens]
MRTVSSLQHLAKMYPGRGDMGNNVLKFETLYSKKPPLDYVYQVSNACHGSFKSTSPINDVLQLFTVAVTLLYEFEIRAHPFIYSTVAFVITKLLALLLLHLLLLHFSIGFVIGVPFKSTAVRGTKFAHEISQTGVTQRQYGGFTTTNYGLMQYIKDQPAAPIGTIVNAATAALYQKPPDEIPQWA